jgi:hypothetical protein
MLTLKPTHQDIDRIRSKAASGSKGCVKARHDHIIMKAKQLAHECGKAVPEALKGRR